MKAIEYIVGGVGVTVIWLMSILFDLMGFIIGVGVILLLIKWIF